MIISALTGPGEELAIRHIISLVFWLVPLVSVLVGIGAAWTVSQIGFGKRQNFIARRIQVGGIWVLVLLCWVIGLVAGITDCKFIFLGYFCLVLFGGWIISLMRDVVASKKVLLGVVLLIYLGYGLLQSSVQNHPLQFATGWVVFFLLCACLISRLVLRRYGLVFGVLMALGLWDVYIMNTIGFDRDDMGLVGVNSYAFLVLWHGFGFVFVLSIFKLFYFNTRWQVKLLRRFESLRADSLKSWAYSNVMLMDKFQRREREIAVNERHAIYKELHDGVSSQLVTMLHSLRSGEVSPVVIENGLDAALNQIKQIIIGADHDRGKSIQEIFFEYCFLLEDLLGGRNGVDVQYAIDGGEYCFLDATAYELKKIMQESVANALKYSSAKSLKVILNFSGEKIFVKLIEFNFVNSVNQLSVSSTGVGLRSLRERASRIGAEFHSRRTLTMRITSVVLPLVAHKPQLKLSAEALG